MESERLPMRLLARTESTTSQEVSVAVALRNARESICSIEHDQSDNLTILKLAGYLAKRKDRVTLAKKYSPNDRYDRKETHREITRIRGSLRSEVATRRRGLSLNYT